MDDYLIYERVAQILAKQLRLDVSSIKLESSLSDDLGADSLDTTELAAAIGEELGYSFNDDEIMKVKTVSDVVDILSSGLMAKKK